MQAIIFDMDDTLVIEEASVNRAFLDTCRLAELRHGTNPDEIHTAARRLAREIWYAGPAAGYCRAIGISSWEGLAGAFAADGPEPAALRDWIPAYRLKAWKAALESCGIVDPELAADMAEAFASNRGRYHNLFEDTLPCLKTLAPQYRLGLLTNGAAVIQRGKMERTGIPGYFAEIIVSGEAGCRKPDGRIFRLMLERLGATPEETLMAGNSLDSDIAGARDAGIKTAWVNRSGEPPDPEITPDMEVRSLAELPGKLP